MTWSVLALACVLTALLSWAVTWLVLRGLVRLGIYDRPVPRSSHTHPRPHGGGIALVPVVLIAWLAATAWLRVAPPGFTLVLAGAALLAVVSWLDDLRGLPASLRLAVQAVAVGLGLWGMTDGSLVFQGFLPPLLDRMIAALLWLWFVNLFNFMDGIDGISGAEAISLGAGLLLVGWLTGWSDLMRALPALLAAASLGFLFWNWPPAKLFLGDVGSVPLGYLLGWLLLLAAMSGEWAAAVILPLYYLADATITLINRTVRGARVWRAHREHFYQRAVRGGASHARVVIQVLACNLGLILLAGAAALGHVWPALGASVLAVALLLAALERRARAGRAGAE